MQQSKLNTPRAHEKIVARVLLLLACSAVFASTTSEVHAAILDEIRLSVAGEQFSGTEQLGVVFHLRAPTWLRAHHIEIAVGAIQNADDAQAFLSTGPVWRLGGLDQAVFVDFGFSPTVIGGSRFNDRDMGGNVHFTSSLSIGRTFGQSRQSAVALRLQHISNGGLNDANPGMDMLGLNFIFNFTG